MIFIYKSFLCTLIHKAVADTLPVFDQKYSNIVNIITIPLPTLLIIHVSFTKLVYYNDFGRITWRCVMTAENELCHHRNKSYFKIYQNRRQFFKIVTIFQNAVFTVFLITIKSLVSIFQKRKKIITHFWLVVYMYICMVFFNISIWVYMYMFFIWIHVCMYICIWHASFQKLQ